MADLKLILRRCLGDRNAQPHRAVRNELAEITEQHHRERKSKAAPQCLTVVIDADGVARRFKYFLEL